MRELVYVVERRQPIERLMTRTTIATKQANDDRGTTNFGHEGVSLAVLTRDGDTACTWACRFASKPQGWGCGY